MVALLDNEILLPGSLDKKFLLGFYLLYQID